MNKAVMVIVLVLVAVGGYAYFNNMKGDSMYSDKMSTSSDEAMMKEDEVMMDKGDESMEAGEAMMAKAVIEIKGSKHSPSTLTVKPGETVTVTNMDLVGHSVTSDVAGLFDTGIVSNGKSVTFTAPTKVGSYPYHCTPHPSMKGTLVVAE